MTTLLCSEHEGFGGGSSEKSSRLLKHPQGIGSLVMGSGCWVPPVPSTGGPRVSLQVRGEARSGAGLCLQRGAGCVGMPRGFILGFYSFFSLKFIFLAQQRNLVPG